MTLADRLVPVPGRAQRVLGVVGVHQREPPAPDGLDQRVEGLLHPVHGGAGQGVVEVVPEGDRGELAEAAG